MIIGGRKSYNVSDTRSEAVGCPFYEMQNFMTRNKVTAPGSLVKIKSRSLVALKLFIYMR